MSRDSSRSSAGPVLVMIGLTTIAALTILQTLRPLRGSGFPDQAIYRQSVPSLNEFRREQAGPDFLLRYGFVDYQGQERRIQCRVNRDEHRRRFDNFGFNERAINAETDRQIRIEIAQALQQLNLAQYVRITVTDGDLRWSVEAPGSIFNEINARARQVVEDYIVPARSRIRAELYAGFGLHLEEGVLSVAYGRLARENSGVLADCFRALARAAEGFSIEQYLGLFVAFVQEIRYVIPPGQIDGRETFEYWVPTEVVVNNHGDCDSKSVLFASLWRSWPGSEVLIILVPDHALVGVAVPNPGHADHIRLGNRYFVLSEVAGPGKSYPGRPTGVVGRGYQYHRVPAVGSQESVQGS